ncbi:hypothetical protein M3Y97_00661100 [Aphelenchoides bicaudatus]|nr:hypothetical protein M3Y97_00661100 [Aphelenchoides bicaudatus]
MFVQLKILLVFVFYSKLASSLSCYDCPSSSPQPCTKTCTGALSCAYEVKLPLQIINEQTLRCENNVAQQGCVGHLESQTVVCFCTSEMCNKNLNTTPTNQPLGIFGQSTPITPIPFGVQPQFGLPPQPNNGLPQPNNGIPPLNGLPQPNNGIPPLNGLPQPINPFPGSLTPSTPPSLIGRKRRAVDSETTIASLNNTDGSASKLALKSSATTFQLQSIFVLFCVILSFNQLF